MRILFTFNRIFNTIFSAQMKIFRSSRVSDGTASTLIWIFRFFVFPKYFRKYRNDCVLYDSNGISYESIVEIKSSREKSYFKIWNYRIFSFQLYRILSFNGCYIHSRDLSPNLLPRMSVRTLIIACFSLSSEIVVRRNKKLEKRAAQSGRSLFHYFPYFRSFCLTVDSILDKIATTIGRNNK